MERDDRDDINDNENKQEEGGPPPPPPPFGNLLPPEKQLEKKEKELADEIKKREYKKKKYQFGELTAEKESFEKKIVAEKKKTGAEKLTPEQELEKKRIESALQKTNEDIQYVEAIKEAIERIRNKMFQDKLAIERENLSKDLVDVVGKNSDNKPQLCKILADKYKDLHGKYNTENKAQEVLEAKIKDNGNDITTKRKLLDDAIKSRKLFLGYIEKAKESSMDPSVWEKKVETLEGQAKKLEQEIEKLGATADDLEGQLGEQKRAIKLAHTLQSLVMGELKKVKNEMEKSGLSEKKVEKKQDTINFSKSVWEQEFIGNAVFHVIDPDKGKVIYTESEIFKLYNKLLTKEQIEGAKDEGDLRLALKTVFQAFNKFGTAKGSPLTTEPRKKIAEILGYDIIEAHNAREEERKRIEKIEKERIENERKERAQNESSKEEIEDVSSESGKISADKNENSDSEYSQQEINELIQKFEKMEFLFKEREKQLEEQKKVVEAKEKEVEEKKKEVEDKEKQLEQGGPSSKTGQKRRQNF